MRRPAVRLLLTLAVSACFVGSIPATTEAGIIPWAYDTVFGPVGSVHARHAGYYGGGYGANYGGCSSCSTPYYAGYSGPAPVLIGGRRAWRSSYVAFGGSGGYATGGCSTCSSGYGYSSTGNCGVACGGCDSCGGGCGINGGYAFGGQSYGGGGCASGQCGVNYPPPVTTNNSGANAATPVTPAAPLPADAKAGTGASQAETPEPMNRSGADDGYNKPGAVTPAPAPGEGFRPRGTGVPTPTNGDPAADQFVPPIKTPAKPATGADASPNDAAAGAAAEEPKSETGAETGTEPATPPVVPKAKVPAKRPNLGEDEKETKAGPRFELNEKITWHREVQHSRHMPTAVRVSANIHRSALFPKMAWRTTSETELAKK